MTSEQSARIEAHVHVVTQEAHRARRRLPFFVDYDDLAAAGRLGLVQASLGFDAARGVPFEAYARRRVLGALLDWMRGEDLLTRASRRRLATTGDPLPVAVPVDVLEEEPAPDDTRPDVRLLHAERVAHLERIIAGVANPRHRRILTHLRSMSPADAARAEGVSIALVSRVRRRAVARARALGLAS